MHLEARCEVEGFRKHVDAETHLVGYWIRGDVLRFPVLLHKSPAPRYQTLSWIHHYLIHKDYH